MRIISADFNAGTESGAIRLGSRGSQEDLRDQGVQVGEWMWLSDGELVVGAQLAIDDRYGIVGIPRWKTLVHLDDYTSDDLPDILRQFSRLPLQPGLDSTDEAVVFQVLTVLEAIAPPYVIGLSPAGGLPLRRAGALHFLGEHSLALIEFEEAMKARPYDWELAFHYLDLLRTIDLDRAVIAADNYAEQDGVGAPVIAACINIWSAAAACVSDDLFKESGHQILDRIAQFQRAPGRDEVRAWMLAQVWLEQGLILLRLGRLEEARQAFELAHTINPNDSIIDEALRLDVFDDRAREITAGLRGKTPLIAA